MGYLGPRSELVQQCGCETDLRSNIKTDPKTRMSSIDGVFAAGDCRRGQSLVVWAINEGRGAARAIDQGVRFVVAGARFLFAVPGDTAAQLQREHPEQAQAGRTVPDLDVARGPFAGFDRRAQG